MRRKKIEDTGQRPEDGHVNIGEERSEMVKRRTSAEE